MHEPIVRFMQTDTPTKVFIVDDSPLIRASLTEMLRHVPNVDVVGEADTPQAAIDGITTAVPDVVILDLHLIGGSGLTVLRTLHPKFPATTFLVLTNHPTPQYRRQCLEHGASDFLDKSHEFVRIIDRIRPAVHTRCPNAIQIQS